MCQFAILFLFSALFTAGAGLSATINVVRAMDKRGYHPIASTLAIFSGLILTALSVVATIAFFVNMK